MYYLIEVVFGSCAGVYSPEIGYESQWARVGKITPKAFWGGLLPVFGIGIGLPLLLHCLL
jgi:hypothetical protein